MIDLIVHVFRSPHIRTSTHLLLMLAIARRCGSLDGECFAKQSTLAEDTRLHPKTVGKVISELEGDGLLKRIKGGVDDSGRRETDSLFLTLKAVTLPATGPGSDGSRRRKPGSPERKSQGVDAPKARESTTPQEETLEETLMKEDARGTREPPEDSIPELSLAAKMIWQAFSQSARNRSSMADVDTFLRSAVRRRPAGVEVEAHLKRIMEGVRAYLATPDARKEHGAFQRGVHRLLEKDRWASFLPDADEAPDEAAARAEHGLGSMEAPTEKAQRLWAELAAQGMPWNADRGPRPEMPGCRISDAIQREFGFTPYTPPAAPAAPDDVEPADDDGSAFL